MPTREDRQFNGKNYYRYPESENISDRNYFRTSGWGGRPSFLHRDVWEYHNGPIPEGHHIHHIDCNPGNNDPSNLECLTGEEHYAHHRKENANNPEWLAARQAQMDHARTFASEWHRSEEGRAWHSEKARKQWENPTVKVGVCTHCGDMYESPMPGDYCSNKCKSAARRASGVDDVDRSCENCGSTFRVNKYTKTTTCSRPCRAALSEKTKTRKSTGQHRKAEKACTWCESTFMGGPLAKYCTKKCAGHAQYAKRKAALANPQ